MTAAELLINNSTVNNTSALTHLQSIKTLVTDKIELENEKDTIIVEENNNIYIQEDKKTLIIEKEYNTITIQSEDIIDGLC